MKTTLSVEDSAKLIELGVSPALANVRFDYDKNGNEIREYQFSLDCLLAILPKKITDRRVIYELRMGICNSLGGGEYWYIKYVNPFLDTDELESFQSAEELIDAVYQELCWIKQQENVKEL